ncbi:MAG: DUF2207 domain-containing protein [Nocardioidaceae bacterium]
MARRASGSVTVMTLVATLIAAVAVCWPLLARVIPTGVSTAPDPVTISDYQGDFQVSADGTLRATETLQTEFPCCRHGIFRFWPIAAPWDTHTRLIPRHIEVTMDGGSVPVDLSWEDGRQYRVAKIGDPDHTVLPGTHTYVISYTVAGVLAPTSAGVVPGESGSWAGESDASVFYWNVVAGGWQMSIGKSESRVTLPTATRDIKCTYGYDSQGLCDVTSGGTDGIVIKTGSLGPRTPVTVRATQTIEPAGQHRLPWTTAYDGVLGQSLPLALIVGVLGLAGIVVGRFWEWRSREPVPGYPVMYEPPPGLGPVQTYYVMYERLPADALTATLLYQAERGLTQLTQRGPKNWLIEGKGGDWAGVDEVTRAVGESLGVTGAGNSFHADGSVSAGASLNQAKGTLATVIAWSRSSGLVVSSGIEALGRVAVLAAFVLAATLVFWRPVGITLWAVPFAAFAIGGIGLLRSGVGTRRTPAGREVWSRAGGFYRLLSTPSSEARFDFSANKQLYTAFIPYAVAFGCADKWAQKYQANTGELPPTPAWYAGPGYSSGFWGTSTGFESFESSLQSSIGAYQATQSSSSSGGGGFSGGGGGGGGGGGSW